MFIKKTVRFIVLCIITMVFIFDGNPEITAHVQSEIGNLICLRQLFISTTAGNLNLKNTCSFHTCSMCLELPSNISTMIITI